MWWYLIKESDNGIRVVYNYGYESYEVSGQIGYNRQTEEFQYLKPADGDSERGMRLLAPHIVGIVLSENAPDKRMIATG